MKTKILFATIAALSLWAILFVLNRFVALPPTLLFGIRWLGVALLVLFGCLHRKLTAWIIIAMAVGAAIGHDWPQFAVSLRVVSAVFLRLIKTTIAPLLFATLVSGIAAHSDLKKVGRMGVKALIYFEVVTTLALVIGLAAINISKAGVGIQVAAPAADSLPAQKVTWQDTLLHTVPENIAKSVADGQILQVVVFSILFGIALALVREERRRPLVQLTESLAETMFKFTNIVMWF